MSRPVTSVMERILARIEINPEVAWNDDPCWLWWGAKVRGHGRMDVGSTVDGTARTVQVHREAYENLVGPIPRGLTLDHLCRVRHCCNPDHLEPVTNGENVLRGDGLTAINARKTHCPAGHPYDAANTYVIPSGGRGCRECRRARRSVARFSA